MHCMREGFFLIGNAGGVKGVPPFSKTCSFLLAFRFFYHKMYDIGRYELIRISSN